LAGRRGFFHITKKRAYCIRKAAKEKFVFQAGVKNLRACRQGDAGKKRPVTSGKKGINGGSMVSYQGW